jgi:hypothetical protein
MVEGRKSYTTDRGCACEVLQAIGQGRLIPNLSLLLQTQSIVPKNVVFWDVPPRGSCKNRRFGGTQYLHHQCDKNL